MRSVVGTHPKRAFLAACYCPAASLPNGVQSLRQWEVCISAARDKFTDGSEVLCVSGLKSRTLVNYKTTVVGVRKRDVNISVPRSRLFSPRGRVRMARKECIRGLCAYKSIHFENGIDE
jgi:hypothetical protein